MARAQTAWTVRVDSTFDASSTRRIEAAIATETADLASQGPLPGGVQVTHGAAGIVVTLADEQGRIRSQRALGDGGSEELLASEVASIVRAFLVALLDERGAQTKPPERASSQPPVLAQNTSTPHEQPPTILERSRAAIQQGEVPRLDPGPARAARWAFNAFYAGSTYAPQVRWRSGGHLEASARVWNLLWVGLAYSIAPQTTVSSRFATLRERTQGLGLSVGAQYDRAQLGWGGDVVLGAVRTARQVTNVSDGFAAARSSAHWSGQVGLRVHVRFRVWRWLWLEAAPGLALPLGLRSAAVDLGALAPVLTPSSVRAQLDVGLAVRCP